MGTGGTGGLAGGLAGGAGSAACQLGGDDGAQTGIWSHSSYRYLVRVV